MRLQEYITEAVSHGRTKYAYPPEECCSVEYMVNWLEYNGLTGDVLTKDTIKWHDPDMSDGNPKYVVRDSNAMFSWVNVYNKFGQIITLPLGKVKNAWSDIKFAKTKEPLTLGFNEGVRCIEFIVNNPDKRITMPFLMDLKEKAIKDKSRLTEAVSHGHKHDMKPVAGCTPEEVTEWLESKGAFGHKYEVSKNIPELIKGEIGYLVGPFSRKAEEQWILVANVWYQRVRLSLNKEIPSVYMDEVYMKKHDISFEQAVKLIELMLDNPNSIIGTPESRKIINEAVSHGNHGGYKDEELPDRYDLKGIKSWLDDMRIPRIQSYTEWKTGASLLHYILDFGGKGTTYISLGVPYDKTTFYTFDIKIDSATNKAFWVDVSRRTNGNSVLIDSYSKSEFDRGFSQMYSSIEFYRNQQ